MIMHRGMNLGALAAAAALGVAPFEARQTPRQKPSDAGFDHTAVEEGIAAREAKREAQARADQERIAAAEAKRDRRRARNLRILQQGR